MKGRHILILLIVAGLVITATSCKKYLNINTDPDSISDAPLAQLLTSAQVNLGFESGSDLFRFSTLIAQQMSGQASLGNQTYLFDTYNITGSDENNVWSSMNSTTLSDLELIITKATATGSPYYSGIAKILKAYEYQKMVDAWGDVPYSEAQKLSLNTQPKYDKAEDIYKAITVLLTEAVTELNAGTSAFSPGVNSVIYSNSSFAVVKGNWIKLANTLKLRIFLHYSKKDPAFTLAQITALVNTAGVTFMASNADNFQMPFFDVTKAQNPIQQFEASRANYLFANNSMVTLMVGKSDPRLPFYFTPVPFTSIPATYKGAKPGDPVGNGYSRIHTYLRGAASGAPPVQQPDGGILPGSIVYTGAAPIRMLTYAEYCFIRAEAALLGAPGVAQTFFTNGITASMQDVGVSATDITAYLAVNGTLTGTNAQQLKQIIEEKYVANNGVAMEPWTDFRRTGYPALVPPSNGVAPAVPRSLFYPQSEIDLNPNAPKQKADLQAKIFWDN
ncbi:MAG: SusD/RagB family nutrient-binding outer membrane lipoprotein [Chitinophagaceae bacterium]